MPPPSADPQRTCDFCASAASEAFEILSKDELGTGLFVYGCPRHEQTAFDSIHGRRKTLRKRRVQGSNLFDVNQLPRVE